MTLEIYIAVAISTFILLGFQVIEENEHSAIDMLGISFTFALVWPILILFVLILIGMKFIEEIYEKRL